MAKYEQYIADRKAELFADLPRSVLEIGPGTGANLAYLPKGCRWIGIEPNPHMHDPLRDKADKLGVEADLREGAAERIAADDCSVDAVICTLVLCSVKNPAQALAEIRRVLRPGGALVYSTCTLLPEENEQVVEAFLRERSDLQRAPVERIPDNLQPLLDAQGQLRCLPHLHDTDGFYAVRLERAP